MRRLLSESLEVCGIFSKDDNETDLVFVDLWKYILYIIYIYI